MQKHLHYTYEKMGKLWNIFTRLFLCLFMWKWHFLGHHLWGGIWVSVWSETVRKTLTDLKINKWHETNTLKSRNVIYSLLYSVVQKSNFSF